MDDLPCVVGAEIDGDHHLLLRTAQGAAIKQAVPDAVDMADGRLRVPWTQEVCELLGRLRAPLIPVMARDYDWPGRFEPFPHQYKIAGFLASHPKAFCLADLGCVDADTEYLSPEGWKRIADYTGGKVAQYHPDTGAAEFVEPTAFVAKPCAWMFRFTGDKCDQMLSPEHRVLLKDGSVRSAAWVAGALDAGDRAAFPEGRDGAGTGVFAGYEARATTDGMKYCFMVPSTFLVFRRNGCVFCSGNTGKTVSSLWAIDYLMRLGRIKKVLIVGPLSILRSAWLDEVQKSFPWMEATVVHHTDPVKRRGRALSQVPIHITNYSGVEVCHAEFMANDYDVVIIDESTSLKTHNTRRWKFMRDLANKAPFLWMLTGTPAVQYPVDAFGQVKLMFQEWDMNTTRFKFLTMEQKSKYRWVPLDTASQTIYDVMQPAIRVAKRDVLKDLPPVVMSTRDVELTDEQRRAMGDLRKQAQADVGGTVVTAVHAAALRTKLIQVASGVVYDDNGTEVQIDFKPRADELVDIVTQVRNEAPRTGPVGGKVIVLCAFTHTVARVAKLLNDTGLNFAVLHGGVSLNRRTEVVRQFQEDHTLDGIVAIPDVMSHGLTLTAANTTVWFTPIDKAEVAIQANNRMDRPGQVQHMHIIRLSGCSAEALMYDRLDERFEQHADLITRYKEFVDAL